MSKWHTLFPFGLLHDKTGLQEQVCTQTAQPAHYWRRCNFSWTIAYVVISPSIPFKTWKIRATRHINLTDYFKLNIMNWALYFDWDTMNSVPVSFPSVWLLWLHRMAQQQVEKAEPSCSLKSGCSPSGELQLTSLLSLTFYCDYIEPYWKWARHLLNKFLNINSVSHLPQTTSQTCTADLGKAFNTAVDEILLDRGESGFDYLVSLVKNQDGAR